jgi:site-specific recombinase XerD
MNAIQTFDNSTVASIKQMLVDQHVQLGQKDWPSHLRSISARNYDSGIIALGEYLSAHGHDLPTRSALEAWRDSMLADGKSISTVKARLSAARKLLRAVADDVTNINVKLVLNDWSKVADPKATVIQDKTEVDYGRRITLDSLKSLIYSIDVSTIKGLRDRALIAVMAGAGLRVSEAVNLTIADMLLTENEQGQRGIRIRIGKHHKSRIVVLNGWNSWVIRSVEAYLGALGVSALENPLERVFRGVKREKGGKYSSAGASMTTRAAEDAIKAYEADYMGESVTLSPHDLRRTYAKLSKQAGMSWEALRANMGHSSVTVTEKYVGLDVDWSERVPNWTIDLEGKK